MTRPDPSFRDRLIASDPRDPALKLKHEQELRAMLEQQLTGYRRIGFIFSLVLGTAFFLGFGAIAVVAPREFPVLARLGFVMGSVFGLAWAVLSYLILRRGTVNLRTDSNAMTGLTWGFTVIMITLFMLLQSQIPDKLTGLTMVVNGLVFLLLAAVFMINNVVEQNHLKTREQLLRLEHHLADLSDRLNRNQP